MSLISRELIQLRQFYLVQRTGIDFSANPFRLRVSANRNSVLPAPLQEIVLIASKNFDGGIMPAETIEEPEDSVERLTCSV